MTDFVFWRLAAMKKREKKSFRGRAFVASTVAISGIGLPGTGLGIHLYQTHPTTHSYEAWMSAHSSLGIVFLVFSIWHVVLNRRVLAKYLRGVKPRLSGGSREAISAVALVALVLFVALAHIYAM